MQGAEVLGSLNVRIWLWNVWKNEAWEMKVEGGQEKSLSQWPCCKIRQKREKKKRKVVFESFDQCGVGSASPDREGIGPSFVSGWTRYENLNDVGTCIWGVYLPHIGGMSWRTVMASQVDRIGFLWFNI